MMINFKEVFFWSILFKLRTLTALIIIYLCGAKKKYKENQTTFDNEYLANC